MEIPSYGSFHASLSRTCACSVGLYGGGLVSLSPSASLEISRLIDWFAFPSGCFLCVMARVSPHVRSYGIPR